MSGNCATGMRVSAIRPAMVMTIAMTIASRGRSTKTAQNMASVLRRRLRFAGLDSPGLDSAGLASPAGSRLGLGVAALAGVTGEADGDAPAEAGAAAGAAGGGPPGGAAVGGGEAGAGLTTMPGRTRWMPSAITVSPSFSPAITTASCGVDWPSVDPPLLRLVLGIDDIDVAALLVRQHRRARDRQRLDRLHALQETVTNSPSTSSRLPGSPVPAPARSGLGMRARRVSVSVLAATEGST